MRILTFCTAFLFSITLVAQCPASDIVLSSQAEVDAFRTTYPNCTELQATLTISGDDIIEVNGLSTITKLGKRLVVENNPLLANLNGLLGVASFMDGQPRIDIINNEALLSIEGLGNLEYSLEGDNNGIDIAVSNNPALISLSGLERISGIVYTLFINNNDALVDLQGLNNIFLIDDVEIRDQDNLITLSGTENFLQSGLFLVSGNGALESFNSFISFQPQGVFILDNPLLEDISGFADSVPKNTTGTITILNNELLSTCASSYLCQLIEVSDFVEIAGNAEGCLSKEEVEDACDEVLDVIISSLNKPNDGLIISPNPARHFMQISLQQEVSFTDVIIYSLKGQVMSRSDNLTLDIAWLPAGVYFVSVQTENGWLTQRFIKK